MAPTGMRRSVDGGALKEVASKERRVALGGGQFVPYPEPKDTAATKVGKANRRRDTKAEIALRSALHRRGLRFRKDHVIRCDGLRVRPDVVFTRARVAIFVDGCFWHRCPDHGTMPRRNQGYWMPKLNANVERDRRVDAALAATGWQVERIWEHEAVEAAAARLAEIVRA